MADQGTHGIPCWYELGTNDLGGAAEFYGSVFGWSVADSGMEGIDYRLATAGDGVMVAGFMTSEGQEGAPPAYWLIYVGVDDCDAAIATATAAGGSVLVPAQDVPGTGRFAVLTDAQGAVFGVLAPERMEGEPDGRAFDQSAPGHGNWHELMTGDPQAAFDFYSRLFGWAKGDTLDMGDMGAYQLFEQGGQTLGGMMGLGNAPVPTWLPYFGTEGVQATIASITSAGGRIEHGPMEVPGGAHIAVAQDPQGAWFAVVGPLGS